LAYPFQHVRALLSAADLTVANLESSLGDVGAPQAKSYTFQAPPAAAEALALAGIDVVSLANNHALDYGPDALLQGLGLLAAAGVQAVGAGPDDSAARTPALVTAGGLTLAFLGYVDVPVEGTGFDTRSWAAGPGRAGLAWAEPETIRADVVAAADRADLVIVLLHSGYEYVVTPSPSQVASAEAALSAGADLVLGHHAHLLQGVDFEPSGVIAYGLGNFAFEIDGDPSTAILNVWLDRDGVRQVEVVPAVIGFGGQPRPAAPAESGPILRTVYYLSSLLAAD
jgi:poly-gamma-glutamate synthesis protein (capsule biosynthesis protein)